MTSDNQELREYAHNIVDTVREALVVLDEKLRVVSASRSFYRKFQLTSQETENRLIYELGNRQWDIPRLRRLLESLLTEKRTIEDFEIKHRFETIGERVMMLNARRIIRQRGKPELILLAIEDVTKSKETRTELLRKTAELEATINSIPEGYIIFGPDRSILRTNDIADQIIGFTREEWNLSYEERIGLLHVQTPKGEALPIEQMPSNRAFKGETVRNEVVKIFRRNRHYWLSMSAAPIMTEKDRMLGVVMEFGDVTERVEAEEQLRRTNGLIQSVTQGTEDMIAAEDLDYRFTYFNEAYSREFRKLWKEEIEVGTSMVEAMSPWPEEQKKARDLWSRAMRGESFKIIMEFGPTKKQMQYYDLRFNPLRDASGRIIGAAHFLRNVTEEVRTEKALKESRRRLALAMNAAALGWWQYDPVTRIAKWDDRYKEIFGVTGHKKLNDDILNKFIHPEDLPALRAKMEAALDPVVPQPFATQYRIIRPDKKMRWVEAHGQATFEGEGENRRATNFVGTVEDITELKRAEEALVSERERLKTVLEVAPVGVVLFEAPSGRLSYLNNRAL
ncbi:MAG: PAS domain-containing protein, partial [Chitinispirillaceae bacterium]